MFRFDPYRLSLEAESAIRGCRIVLTSRRDFFKLGGAKPILNQAEDLPPLGSLSVPDRQSLKLAIAEKGKEKQMKNKIMKRTSVIVAIALAFGALDGTASASLLYAVTG